MPTARNAPESNGVLAVVRDETRQRLLRDVEPVRLDTRAVLAEEGEQRSLVYFITSGVVSRLGTTRSGRSLELACTGREGAVGVLTTVGINRLPYRLVVQLPGEALRIPSSVLRQHLKQSPELLERLTAYCSVVITQLAQSGVCARFHTSQQRLCRWLVTASGRAHVTHLPWSHEWIAEMVGGPRSSVSEAASALRDQGIVEYHRRGLLIRDMPRLRAAACECAWIVERAVAEFMGDLPPDVDERI